MEDAIIGPQVERLHLGPFGDKLLDEYANCINKGHVNAILYRSDLMTYPLIELIKSDSIGPEDVAVALKMRCDPNVQQHWLSTEAQKHNFFRDTPAHAAISKGCVETFKLLLDAKADVESTKQDLLTTCIIREKSADCVRVLLERCGAVPNAECIEMLAGRYCEQFEDRANRLFAMYRLMVNKRPVLAKVNHRMQEIETSRKRLRMLPLSIRNPHPVKDSTAETEATACLVCHIRTRCAVSDICLHNVLCLQCAQHHSHCPRCMRDANEWLVIQ